MLEPTTQQRGPAASAEMAAFVTANAGRSRLAITGTSMRPLLRAGMIVGVERLEGEARIGDILVFRTAQGIVAHRVIARRGSAYVTSGDAVPQNTEYVLAGKVIGRVVSVWSGAEQSARRVDGRRFRLLGRALVASRSLRATAYHVRWWVALASQDPEPRLHPPAFRALVAATLAFEAGRYEEGVGLLGSLPAEAFMKAVRDHGMAGIVSRWLDAAESRNISPAPEIRTACRTGRWASALQADNVLRRAQDVVRLLRDADIEPILLKGAARLAAGETDADVHYSGDVDVIVPLEAADRAVAALRSAGYLEVANEKAIAFYARRLQHRAPLVPPDGNTPVEIHVSLAIPGGVSQTLDYRALAPHARIANGPLGQVLVLDDVGSALHLAYHARDLHVWRDIVLLSRYLRRLSVADRAALATLANCERRDGVRLRAVLAAAGAVAGTSLHAPASPLHRYLSWAIAREDFPLALQRRARIVEGYFARTFLSERGTGYAIGQLHRWLYNVLALPVVLRWRKWSARTFGDAANLFETVPYAASRSLPAEGRRRNST